MRIRNCRAGLLAWRVNEHAICHLVVQFELFDFVYKACTTEFPSGILKSNLIEFAAAYTVKVKGLRNVT